MRTIRTSHAAGFTLIEIMMVVALMSIVFGIAVPAASNAVEGMRLGIALRDVERELQAARLNAVSVNRPMRVRLNCPAAGQLRVVEVTGVLATDTNGSRCNETVFPFPGPKDADPATPAADRPVKYLHVSIGLSGPDLQFSPNGTTQWIDGGALQPITIPATVTVSKGADASTVTVNGLGKVDIQ